MILVLYYFYLIIELQILKRII